MGQTAPASNVKQPAKSFPEDALYYAFLAFEFVCLGS